MDLFLAISPKSVGFSGFPFEFFILEKWEIYKDFSGIRTGHKFEKIF